MDYTKYYKKAIRLMDNILKQDDFSGWLKEGENIPEDYISNKDREKINGTCSVMTVTNFEELYNTHCNTLLYYLMEVVRNQKIMWLCQHHFEVTMEGYLKQRDQISNPNILKVIDGYKEWKENK